MRSLLLTSLLFLGLGTSAFAATGQFDNNCAWGLANHKDVQTDCTVSASIKGSTYCFSSEDARAKFMANPDENLKKAEGFYNSEHQG